MADPQLSDWIDGQLRCLVDFWQEVPHLEERAQEWHPDELLLFVVEQPTMALTRRDSLDRLEAAGRLTEEQRGRLAEVRALEARYRDVLEAFCQ